MAFCDGLRNVVNKSQAVTFTKRITGSMKEGRHSPNLNSLCLSLRLSHRLQRAPSIPLPATKTLIIELERLIASQVNTLIIENRPCVRVRNHRRCLLPFLNLITLGICTEKSPLSASLPHFLRTF